MTRTDELRIAAAARANALTRKSTAACIDVAAQENALTRTDVEQCIIPLARAVVRRTGRTDLSDDLLQVAVMAVISAAESWKPEHASGVSLSAHAWRSAARAVSLESFRLSTVVGGGDRQRRRALDGDASAQPVSMHRILDDDAYAPADDEDMIVDRITLESLRAQATPEDRELLRWRYDEEQTLAQIAAKLRCSVSTAHARLESALARLRKAAGLAE